MCIMKRLPEQQLQTLQATDIFDESSSALSSTVFASHSETLHTIDFPAPQILKSTTLQDILMFCRALEVLQAHDDYSIYNTLAIEDAVATEWACTRIRHLEISVEFTPDGRDPGCLADPTKTSWKKQDHKHWGMLDKFYTQIGKLENLEVLHIKSAKANLPLDEEDDMDEGIPYRATCLPGLLALEDEATSQIGFLSRWDGLTKLQDFSGSFLVTTQEAAARMGHREAEWFVTHLPALRRATLWDNPYSEKCSDDDVPDVVRIIQRHRPELKDFSMSGAN
ncbi:hypothetical protein BGX24_000863 [Mortierella sp. AD032]|nr:hypothetical protein BGX24_000863 [Mortierella sp. AD032]